MNSNNVLKITLAIIAIIVVPALICGIFVKVSGLLPPLGNMFNNMGGQKPTVITSNAVIEKIEQVSELTTTKYTIQIVIKSETVGEWFTFGTTDVKLLLVAKGTVRAGLDLSKLDPSAVTISADGERITIYLPPVKILDRDHILSSNPSDTYLYDVQKGIAAPDTTSSETELRGMANDQILAAACEDGILNEAAQNAQTVVEQLFKSIASEVTVISASIPSQDACNAK